MAATPETFFIINASAGSGKTHTMVVRYLSLALKNHQHPGIIRHILALTFTNKAAQEMKHRILSWLEDIRQNTPSGEEKLRQIQEHLITNGENTSTEILRQRAEKLLQYMLHHYSAMNISTIDKFNAGLIRQFALEFGLPYQFNIEIDEKPLVMEAVDEVLEQLNPETASTEAYLKYIISQIEEGKFPDLRLQLLKSSSLLLSDKHLTETEQLGEIHWQRFFYQHSASWQRIRNLQNEIKTKAAEALQLAEAQDVQEEDFANGSKSGLLRFFIKAHKGSVDLSESAEKEESRLLTFQKGCSAKGKAKQDSILFLLPQLLSLREEMILMEVERKLLLEKVKAELPNKVNFDIVKKLQEIEDEREILLISKFNTLIRNHLSEEPSEFIYEKVGTRFHHYFLDEFQDTSALQWANMIPLRDETITHEDRSFTLIGDPKQSIYRFRGGDSQIMLDMLRDKAPTPIKASTIQLENNYRSAWEIVDFNNRLYESISQSAGLSEEHRDLFSIQAKQNPIAPKGGRVRMDWSFGKKIEETQQDFAEKISAYITENLALGYRQKDICILCRSNAEISFYTQQLDRQKISVNGEETTLQVLAINGLELQNSLTLQACIHLLQWSLQPSEKRALAEALLLLQSIGRLGTRPISEILNGLKNCRTEKEILQYLAEEFSIHLEAASLGPYEEIQLLLREISIADHESEYITTFLEHAFHYLTHYQPSKTAFLEYWDTQLKSKSIQKPEDLDAIEITTIHSSKGLEYPIVFLPEKNQNKDHKYTDWFSFESEEGEDRLLIGSLQKNLSTYSPQVAAYTETNTYKNLIDRLCVQYVATTRARDQLYLLLEYPKKEAHTELIRYFFSQFPDTEGIDLYPYTPETKEKRALQKNSSVSGEISFIPLSRQNIQIATPSRSYQNKNIAVKNGILIHNILSKMQSPKDMDKTLNQLKNSGEITHEEEQIIRCRLNEVVLKHPDLIRTDGIHLSERDILWQLDGKIVVKRPDKIIEFPEGYYLYDFKTGKEKAEDSRQLQEYADLLSQMGKNIIHQEIIYIE